MSSINQSRLEGGTERIFSFETFDGQPVKVHAHRPDPDEAQAALKLAGVDFAKAATYGDLDALPEQERARLGSELIGQAGAAAFHLGRLCIDHVEGLADWPVRPKGPGPSELELLTEEAVAVLGRRTVRIIGRQLNEEGRLTEEENFPSALPSTGPTSGS